MGITTAAYLGYASLALTGYQVYSGEKAADEQFDLAQANAERQRLESNEAVKRLAARQEASESQAKAIASASGVKVTGSVTDYLDVMQKTNKDEINWLQASGLSAAAIMQREGQVQADMTRRGARAAGAGRFLSTADKAGWFE